MGVGAGYAQRHSARGDGQLLAPCGDDRSRLPAGRSLKLRASFLRSQMSHGWSTTIFRSSGSGIRMAVFQGHALAPCYQGRARPGALAATSTRGDRTLPRLRAVRAFYASRSLDRGRGRTVLRLVCPRFTSEDFYRESMDGLVAAGHGDAGRLPCGQLRLFARKFDVARDSRVPDLIDEHLLLRSGGPTV